MYCDKHKNQENNLGRQNSCRGCEIEVDKVEIKRLTAALERLGSNEAMSLSFAINNNTNEGRELGARLDYARAALYV